MASRAWPHCCTILLIAKLQRARYVGRKNVFQVVLRKSVLDHRRLVPSGKIIEANDAFLRLFEFERDEVIGRTTVELNI